MNDFVIPLGHMETSVSLDWISSFWVGKVKWGEPHAKYLLQSMELVLFLNEMVTNTFTLAN